MDRFGRMVEATAEAHMKKAAGKIDPSHYLFLNDEEKETLEVEEFKDEQAIVYKWINARGRYAGERMAAMFVGRSKKPRWEYVFKSESQRQNRIDKTLELVRERIKGKQEQQKMRREFKHDFKAGDILYDSWGYDQTNIDFYVVVGTTDKSVKIKECGSKTVKTTESGDYKVVANPSKVTGPVMTKRVSPHGNNVKVRSNSWASKWDGKPLYETGPYGGH